MDKSELYNQWREVVKAWDSFVSTRDHPTSNIELWAQDGRWDLIYGAISVIENHINDLKAAIEDSDMGTW